MRAESLRKIVREGRKRELPWRYVFNLGPTLSYRLHHSRLQDEALRVVQDLDENGIALTTVDTLFPPSTSLYAQLDQSVAALEAAKQRELETARLNVDDPGPIGEKTFMLELLDRNPTFDPDSIWARFALQSPVLEIANAYFGMLTQFRYYNVWHTLASSQTPPRESQLWHRDREDYLILKMFVYMVDVDVTAGPFTYAKGTHFKGRLRGVRPEFFMEEGVQRSTDEQFEKAVGRDHWLQAVGRKGAIVFADTRGYHKGGFATRKDRILFKCMFTSRASQSIEFMKWPRELAIPSQRERAFALGRASVGN